MWVHVQVRWQEVEGVSIRWPLFSVKEEASWSTAYGKGRRKWEQWGWEQSL